MTRHSLLAKAKRSPKGKMREIGPQEKELAIAWARGEVSTAQVADALGLSRNNAMGAYITLARALRVVIQETDF